MSTLWGVVSSLTSLFYAGMQVMVPCLPPAPLSTAVINTDEVRALQFLIIYECVCVCIYIYKIKSLLGEWNSWERASDSAETI